ncbi:pyridoxal phosphate-dependent aminotransferase [Bacteroidota bacterium]|nr:pyridoxal phosphate-dependent aminotransferase [Bacteroidota bacterium]MDC3153590.1 pyridoxal phosphate-dependent aminotransferase [Bacteroidota bacterium]MDC3230650.1 pyridoxal phosphate-dependent aminotransferase [Bacteroidota bacterium]
MNKLSTRINNLSESATLAMSRLSRELKQQGKDVISLSLGEPDFNTPDFIKKSAVQAINDNFSHYTPVPGILELRKSICKKFYRDNNLEFNENQIVVSTGAKQSIANVCLSLLDKGDEVILLAPYWVSYFEIVKLCGAKPIVVESKIENNFKSSVEEVEKKISNKTKLLIFSSPCNPSGSVYSKKELVLMADMLKKYDNLFVISDEIYEHINFTNEHYSFGLIESMKDRTITVNGVSKGFAMTGWRVGYIGAPEFIASACNKIQGQITSATCSIAQKATQAAVLSKPEDSTNYMKIEFKKRRDLIVNQLLQIEGIKCNVPDGAFYVFPDISYFFDKKDENNSIIKNSNDLSMYLLNDAHVATVAGDAFGTSECIRISYATSIKNITEATQRIKKSLEKLK